MINVLIPSIPDDAHAIYVKLALEKKGHAGVLWYTTDLPEQQKHSFEILNDEVIWHSRGTNFKVENNKQFDIVWFRRPRKPVLPDSIHPDDKENTMHENMEFFKTIWQVIAPNAFWINPVDNSRFANCKLQQLKIASEVGLKIPTTLISNDPDKIKLFIKNHIDDQVIYKPLYPVNWINKQETRFTYTSELKLEYLPSDSMLQNTPGIYQKKIIKAFELRVTYFGDHAITAKIKSQEHPKGIMDWRRAPVRELLIEEYKLPVDIDNLCKKFMKKLGLVFGCFDFIVTPNGEYYFLEINEQGQFLWIEEVNPEIKMLDKFTNFLIKSVNDCTLNNTLHPVSLSDFTTEMIEVQKNAMSLHVNPYTSI